MAHDEAIGFMSQSVPQDAIQLLNLDADYIIKLVYLRKRDRKQNFSARVNKSWIVALYQSMHHVRYLVVPDRKGSTLSTLITQVIGRNLVIHADELRGFA